MSEQLKQRIIKSNLFACRNINKFISSVKTILPYRGFSDSIFIRCGLESEEFLTKLFFYTKSDPELYDATDDTSAHQNIVEIKVLELFKKEFIKTGITPHIIEVIYTNTCENLLDVAPNDAECGELIVKDYEYNDMHMSIKSIFCRNKNFVMNKLSHNKYSYVIMEEADVTLDFYVKKRLISPAGLAVLVSMLFQIVYTLHCIKLKYPSFKHGDLHTDNILIQFDENFILMPSEQKYVVYETDEKFAVPYFGATSKIIDFGFTQIDEIDLHSDIKHNKKIMFGRVPNDMIVLLHHIYHGTGRASIIEQILNKLDPGEFYKKYNTDHIRKNLDKLLTYEEMLKTDLFDEYRNFNPPSDSVIAEFNSGQS